MNKSIYTLTAALFASAALSMTAQDKVYLVDKDNNVVASYDRASVHHLTFVDPTPVETEVIEGFESIIKAAEIKGTLDIPGQMHGMCYLPDGRIAASFNTDGKPNSVVAYDENTGETELLTQVNDAWIWTMTVHDDYMYMACKKTGEVRRFSLKGSFPAVSEQVVGGIQQCLAVKFDKAGNMYALTRGDAEGGKGTVYKFNGTNAGSKTVFAQLRCQASDMCFDLNGNLLIGTNNGAAIGCIYQADASGQLSVAFGSDKEKGELLDGAASAAKMQCVRSLYVDKKGYLYVNDVWNITARVTPGENGAYNTGRVKIVLREGAKFREVSAFAQRQSDSVYEIYALENPNDFISCITITESK